MKLRLDHLLLARPDGARPPDAIGVPVDAPDRRFFVPGWLPCGECGRCRRGWLAACPRGRRLDASAPEIEVSDRFLTDVDDPPGSARLHDAAAACAGLVAEVQEASARAGLGPGDAVVWIGDDARCALGARLAAARGCASFTLGAPGAARAGVTDLDASAGAESWAAALAAPAASAPGGFQERRLFLSRAGEDEVAAALALAAPGAVLTFLDGRGPASLRPADLPLCRIIVAAGWGYHPDFVPEALAALRSDEGLVADLLAGETPPWTLVRR
jgi:hypothetical protein